MAVLHIAVTFLFNAAWQITLLAGITYICSFGLRRTTAWIIHAIWVFALLASAFLPLLSLTYPMRRVYALRD